MASSTRRRAPLYALWLANAISWIGNALSTIVIPWYVLSTTGSAAKTGITAFFGILPIIIATFAGSALIDRIGYRRVSIAADLASGVAVALIPLLDQTVGLAFWQLQALVFLGALLDAPGSTARAALVPDLAELAQLPLERATAPGDAINRAATMVGAPLAGVLIGLLGPAAVLWLNAASFLISALLVALVIPATPRPQREEQPYLEQLRAGLRFIKSDGLMRTLLITVMGTNFLDAAVGGVLLPVYARDVLGSAVALGLLSTAFGVGAVCGALLYSAVGPRLPRRPLFIACFVVVGLRIWALAALPSFPLLLVLYGMTGICVAPLNPLMDILFFERVPAEMRGQLMGVSFAGSYLAMPLGVLLAGYVVEIIGLIPTLIVTGALYLCVTLGMLASSHLRQMERPAEALIAEPIEPTVPQPSA